MARTKTSSEPPPSIVSKTTDSVTLSGSKLKFSDLQDFVEQAKDYLTFSGSAEIRVHDNTDSGYHAFGLPRRVSITATKTTETTL